MTDQPTRPDFADENERLEWVPDFEGLYAVTDKGRVISYHAAPKELSCHHSTDVGYPAVHLHRDGERTPVEVHRLVLSAFRRPPEDGEECRHLNGDPKDNRIENLEWGTRKENIHDQYDHDTIGRKLAADDVVEMKIGYDDGRSIADLSDEYGVNEWMVRRVLEGVTWPDVGGPTFDVVGRARGEGHGGAELTEDQVREARRRKLCSDDPPTYTELAEDYPASRKAVYCAVVGETWAHVPMPECADDEGDTGE